jgi:ribosomal protein L11 methylase PrmA
VEPPDGFDLATVNVVPREIREDLELLIEALKPGGLALFSGILCSELDAAVAEVAARGLEARRDRSAGEWAAFVAERAP